MGRQLQLATTTKDEVELLRFISRFSPIRVLQCQAHSIEELWFDDWETREIELPGFARSFDIWPQKFAWSPEYRQTGGPDCRPEHAGQFYVANAHTAPVFQFTRSFLHEHSYGRIYWARDFSAPDGLDYDTEAFARLTDSVWRWIRKVSHRSPDARTHSPYFLPDAWSRYGRFAAYHAAEKRATDELVARNRKYMIEVLGGRGVKDEG
jgi:hypothetical protein